MNLKLKMACGLSVAVLLLVLSCQRNKPRAYAPEPDDYAVPNKTYKINRNEVPGATCYVLTWNYGAPVSMSCLPKAEAASAPQGKRRRGR